MNTIKVNDIVEVLMRGCTYTTYEHFLKHYNKLDLFCKWRMGNTPGYNSKYIVRFVGEHESQKGQYIAAIERDNNIFLIGAEGLRVVGHYSPLLEIE